MKYASYDSSRYLPNLPDSIELGEEILASISSFFKISDTSLKILEIGCASGSLLKVLQMRKFENILGIDLDKELILHGKNILGVNVLNADWNSFMLEEGPQFDLIIALDVLEHISPFDLSEILINTNKRLSSNGKLILRMPNADCPFVLPTYYGDLTHKTLLTPKHIHFLLKESNYKGKITIKETVPNNKIKRLIYLIMHYLFVKPIISIFHYHFYGKLPKCITRNMYVCAEV
jgi:2-polyprenyl-3-methyl-5-hydroxy-6-metoxy-1,4-benzoquinol methylase